MTDGHKTVSIGGEAKRVEPVSARKASRAFALLRHISKRIPDLAGLWGKAAADYREQNTRKLSRAQARLEYPPRPLIHPQTLEALREPVLLDNGEPNPHAGDLVMVPSAIDRLTDADWEASGNVLEVPDEPHNGVMVMAILEPALELAEAHVFRLLALFLMSNEDVARRHKDGTLDDELEIAADWLLDNALGDEVLELAVVCGETVDEQFRRKASELGDRVGNALRLVGLAPTTRTTTTSPMENGANSSTPSSSTDGPESSDGPPTSSSMPTGDSSPDSESSPPRSEQPERPLAQTAP